MASEKWAGFTDEDIERIKTNPTNRKNSRMTDKDGIPRKDNSGPLKIKEIAVKTLQPNFPSESSKDETSDSDHDFIRRPHRSKKNSKLKEFPSPVLAPHNTIDCNNMPHEENNTADMSDDSCKSPTDSRNENLEDKFLETEPNSNISELELFEIRRKKVEAENARRRALINKAITDKKMQTQAEAMKLAKITQELNRLDSILSADVSILRDYIEQASMEFSKAEKRYLKAEKEFIEAKLDLYEKMQRKEQLTEHLCAIIEQNENRKANKLVELMKQLEMEAIIEDYDINNSEPVLSKFCLLNDETYHCCQTLKPSQKTPSNDSKHDEEAMSQTPEELNTSVDSTNTENCCTDTLP
ncbi:RAB6-interacting golgin-like [Argiope bruennichi]|uniref:RAB6-interacting golgin n=1 Tax=Argiope bruennichi TaxID=94029 RepID=A0A8T0ELG2_ARGBR|nr:RAB6-interacting golgin-like [Argiope bruennichi]KAF8774832.1 RAB6-interacting golgin like protein [Argiope bruennichi]